MSVIHFEQDDINKIVGMMSYRHQEISKILRHSPHFSHYYVWLHNLDNNTSQEQAMEVFINRMLWYAFVANRVAYALQYREDVTFRDIEVNYAKTESMICTTQELFCELGSLVYNLRTNVGDKFIEKKWYEPLYDIYTSLGFSQLKQ